MIPVNYTLQELQDLTALLDIAIKSGGLRVAGAAFLLHQKHAIALEAHNKPASETTNVVSFDSKTTE